jgi:hypothetical protein
MIARNGLRESLEAFAKRAGVSREEARPYWRAWAVWFLADADIGETFEAIFDAVTVPALALCRICPGFEVITRNPMPEEVDA